jgi:hypothetical protein
MKTLKHSLIYSMLITAFSACAVGSLSVVSDYDRDADFSDYETFYWTDNFQMENGDMKESLFYNSLIKKRLKQAIQDELEARDYALNPIDPDLLVDSRVIVQETTRASNYYPYPYYGYYPWGYNYAYPFAVEKKEGGVVIDLIDKDRRQLVWQGFAPDVIRAATEDKQREIRLAVAKIFAQYPYRAGRTVSSR